MNIIITFIIFLFCFGCAHAPGDPEMNHQILERFLPNKPMPAMIWVKEDRAVFVIDIPPVTAMRTGRDFGPLGMFGPGGMVAAGIADSALSDSDVKFAEAVNKEMSFKGYQEKSVKYLSNYLKNRAPSFAVCEFYTNREA